MGLFTSKDEKQAKEEAKLQQYLDENKINELQGDDKLIAQSIAKQLANATLFNAAFTLQGRPELTTNWNYYEALVKQNWIMINQLNRIITLLSK